MGKLSGAVGEQSLMHLMTSLSMTQNLRFFFLAVKKLLLCWCLALLAGTASSAGLALAAPQDLSTEQQSKSATHITLITKVVGVDVLVSVTNQAMRILGTAVIKFPVPVEMALQIGHQLFVVYNENRIAIFDFSNEACPRQIGVVLLRVPIYKIHHGIESKTLIVIFQNDSTKEYFLSEVFLLAKQSKSSLFAEIACSQVAAPVTPVTPVTPDRAIERDSFTGNSPTKRPAQPQLDDNEIAPQLTRRKQTEGRFVFTALSGIGYAYVASSHWISGFLQIRLGIQSDRVELSFGPRFHIGSTLIGLEFYQLGFIAGSLNWLIHRHIRLGINGGIGFSYFQRRTIQSIAATPAFEFSPELQFRAGTGNLGQLVASIRPGFALEFGEKPGFLILTGVGYAY